MPRIPASITQADIARSIRAAKQSGATEIEVRIGGAAILVRMAPSTTQEKPLEQKDEIIL